jgi:hypothetical protein
VKCLRLSRGRYSPEHAQPGTCSAFSLRVDTDGGKHALLPKLTRLEVLGGSLDIFALNAHQVRHRVPNRAPLQVPVGHSTGQFRQQHAFCGGWMGRFTYATSSDSIASLLYGLVHSGQSHSSAASRLTISGSLIRSRSRLNWQDVHMTSGSVKPRHGG